MAEFLYQFSITDREHLSFPCFKIGDTWFGTNGPTKTGFWVAGWALKNCPDNPPATISHKKPQKIEEWERDERSINVSHLAYARTEAVVVFRDGSARKMRVTFLQKHQPGGLPETHGKWARVEDLGPVETTDFGHMLAGRKVYVGTDGSKIIT